MHPATPDDGRIRDALDGVGRWRGAPPSNLVRLGRRSRLFGDPAPWRGFLAVTLVALLGLGGASAERDARRGRRFLAAHAAA